MIRSDVDGLKIELIGQSIPIFNKEELAGATKVTFSTELASVLPSSIDLTDLANELKSFVGEWQACYPGTSAYMLTQPIFNSRGDILFRLRPVGTLVKSMPQQNGIGGSPTEGARTPTGSRRSPSASTSRSPRGQPRIGHAVMGECT